MKRKIVCLLSAGMVVFCSCTSYKNLYFGCSNGKDIMQKQNENLIIQNIAKIESIDSLRKQNESLKLKNESLRAENHSLKIDIGNKKN